MIILQSLLQCLFSKLACFIIRQLMHHTIRLPTINKSIKIFCIKERQLQLFLIAIKRNYPLISSLVTLKNIHYKIFF